jgi:hypothetical protein
MSDSGAESRLAELERLVATLQAETRAARDRAEIENLFAQYMYLHNAFEDERIIDLWAAPGTPGIRAQYSNNGVYNTWETITYYHRGRPRPQGKLIFHYLTTPMIEVAEDGATAKGLWIASGVESGLTDLELPLLKDLTKLEHLALSNNPKITDRGMATIQKFERLQALYLANTAVGDKGLAMLRGLDAMRTLNLVNTRVTADAADKFVDDMPNLRSIRR